MNWKHAALALIIFATLSNAAGQTNELKDRQLAVAVEDVKCRVNFTVAVLDSIIRNSANASFLTHYIKPLQNDESQLQTYANNGDVDGFRNYTENEFDPDLRIAARAIVVWGNIHGGSLSNNSKQAIRLAYVQLRSTFETCQLNALKELAEAKIDFYNSTIKFYRAKIANLTAKDVRTSGLTAIVTGAQAQIITPLQSAVDNATNATELMYAMRQYCLFDGCQAGTNYHIATKFEIEKLGRITDAISSTASSYGFGDNLTQAQNYLSNARSALGGIGTAPYTSQQQDAIWNNIGNAAQAILDIIKNLG